MRSIYRNVIRVIATASIAAAFQPALADAPASGGPQFKYQQAASNQARSRALTLPSGNLATDLSKARNLEAFFTPTTAGNQIVRLQTNLVTPPKPANIGTIFVWPGLQPDPSAAHYLPIGNGVLQPVLTWGPSCAPTPTAQPLAYSTWWISGQYVNTSSDAQDRVHKGCLSGDYFSANPGDLIYVDMVFDRNSGLWTQTLTNGSSHKTATYSIYMNQQEQNIAYFMIEEYDNAHLLQPATFLNTKITYLLPDPNACVYSGSSPTVSRPYSDASGLNCSIDSIILKSGNGN